MDVRIKSFVPKAFWGFQRKQQIAVLSEPTSCNTLAAVNERELILIVGSRLTLLDHTETFNSKLIPFGQRTVTEIINIVLSSNSTYVAISVKLGGLDSQHATMIIIENDKETVSTFRKQPRLITHTRANRFEGISFSANSELIATFTDSPSEGVLIFDRLRCVLVKQIPLASAVFAVSFNPENDSRICTTGARNLFQFWRYTSKTVHSAPIVGLIKDECMYTSHVWLPENRLVAGTDKGLLVLVQACDVQSTHQAFGNTLTHNYLDDGKVHYLRSYQSFVIAGSAINSVAVFELKKVVTTTSVGNNHLATLVLRDRFHLQGVLELRGLQLSMKRFEDGNPEPAAGSEEGDGTGIAATAANGSTFKDCLMIVAAASNAISLFELLLPPAALLAQNNTEKDGNRMASVTTNKAAGAGAVPLEPDWKDIQGRNVFDFHSEKIDSIAVAVRSSTFITSSEKDFSVRAWNYNKPYVAGDLVEYFFEHPNDMPHRVDLHPTGLFAAFACNDEVSEAAITQSGLEIVRRMPTKQPFVTSDGISLANSHPVSLVKYAHGGHLLAVVCGKIIQLFNMYDMDYSKTKTHHHSVQPDGRGQPKRVMSVVHTTHVSDVTFSTDDSVLFSCSVEGTVLSHAVSCFPVSSPLIGEYVTRGVTAAKIVTSESKVVVVSYISLASASSLSSSASAMDSRQHATNITASDLANYSYLSVWQGGQLSDSPAVVYLEVPAKEIAIQTTTALAGGGKVDLCVIGCIDGSVLLCLLPLPVVVRVLSSALGLTSSGISASGTHHMPEWDHSTTAEKSRLNNTTNSSAAALADSLAATGGMAGTAANDLDDSEGDQHPRAVDFLDESRCKCFLHHTGPVSGLVVTPDSKRIFSAGSDGAIFMLQLTKPKKGSGDDSDSEDEGDTHVANANGARPANEDKDIGESAFMLADKSIFETMRDKAMEEKYAMEDKVKENVATLAKVSEQRDIEVDSLRTQLKREVGKRDAIILREREEHLKQKHKLQNQLKLLEKKRTDEISRVEMTYEQKLATEALYLDRMRQAYEEMVLNARLDRKKAVDAEIEQQLRSSADAAFYGKLDAQKQKEALLLYVEYINARHAEVIASLEKSQEKERTKFKKELAAAGQSVVEAKAEGIEKIVMANLSVKQLTADVAGKEDQVLRLKSDLEWHEGRIVKLEGALHQATTELKKRTEMYEKWEFKAGDQQQQISEMERIRRALTHQLHGLRQAIGPKDEQILRITEKLEEMDREYDQALRAVSEKDIALSQKSAVLHMLQKQVRDLRISASRKEASLRRAAKLFEQYKKSLMEDSTVAGMISNGTLGAAPAQVQQTQSAVNGPAKAKAAMSSSATSVAAKTDSNLALQRLDDVLKAHVPSAVEAAAAAADNEPETMNDADVDTLLAEAEKERQVMQLHKNVNALKTNLEKSELLSAVKVKKHLTDNEHLVQEVNRMRHEIRSLSTENQRLHVSLAEARRSNSHSAKGRQRERDHAAAATHNTAHQDYGGLASTEQHAGSDISQPFTWIDYGEHHPQPQTQNNDDTGGDSDGVHHQMWGSGVRFEGATAVTADDGNTPDAGRTSVDSDHHSDGHAATGGSLPPLTKTTGSKSDTGTKVSSSADQKIKALMAANEETIRSGKASPFEILSYHQHHDEKPGITPQMSLVSGGSSDHDHNKSNVISLRDSLATGSATDSLRVGSAPRQVKLNTATIQLPDVAAKKGSSKKRGSTSGLPR